MATTFKTILNNDVTSTRTLLHEAIPLTGSIVSGTYSEANIKNYSHGMFQSVYDYPFLSSSANHIFDLAVGYHSDSSLSSSASTQNTKKINIYNQMAQTLVGYDDSGNIRKFDRDGNFATTTDKMDSVFFLNFSRLLSKDEIKKGSFQLGLNVSGTYGTAQQTVTLQDANASTDYRTNSPAGEYGLLFTASTGDPSGDDVAQGLIYYQAGVAVITSSVWFEGAGHSDDSTDLVVADYFGTINAGAGNNTYSSFEASLVSGSISGSCDGIRNRIENIQFNNTTELNSTIYFCRANHNEFNYSANPTYLSNSKIQVKDTSLDNPISYITSVGLYSADNELLAVAKLSEPLKKDPTNELTLRVRLDY
jgi:hypothetical protein